MAITKVPHRDNAVVVVDPVTDKQPDGAQDGRELYESDTKKGFVFNENTESWDPV